MAWPMNHGLESAIRPSPHDIRQTIRAGSKRKPTVEMFAPFASRPRGYHAGMNRLQESSATPSCNIELKACLVSLDAARQIASSLADTRLPDQHQIDTYFYCRDGRLKLREIVGQRAELIAYRRPNESGPKVMVRVGTQHVGG